MSDIVKYTPLDLDDLDAQEKAIGFNQGGGQFYQFKDGKNVIRVLPGVHGQKAIIPFWKHFVGAAEGGKAWGGACPLKMAKMACPVCQAAAKLSRGTDADRKLSKDITARQRYVANILDRANPDLGPQVAEFGPQIYNDIKDLIRTTGENPTDPGEAGFDLIVEKSGSGMSTEYKTIAQRKNSPLHPDARQMSEWLEQAADLSGNVIIQEEHEISNRLGGTIIGHLLGSRGRTAPAARPSGRTAAKPSDVIDVDGDVDDDIDY
jgi:hypothetical protein